MSEVQIFRMICCVFLEGGVINSAPLYTWRWNEVTLLIAARSRFGGPDLSGFIRQSRGAINSEMQLSELSYLLSERGDSAARCQSFGRVETSRASALVGERDGISAYFFEGRCQDRDVGFANVGTKSGQTTSRSDRWTD